MGKKRKKTYSIRKWLNGPKSPSTGSVSAYSGPDPWGAKEPYAYLEVADCHSKVRLHKAKIDTPKDFVRKLRKLAAAITDFADHLEGGK